MNEPHPGHEQLLARLLGPSGPELTCDECFELARADADSEVAGMRAHLEGCPSCSEEHASLKALIRLP